MNDQDRSRALTTPNNTIPAKRPLDRKRLNGSVLLLSSVVGVTALGAGTTSNRDRDINGVLYPDRPSAAAPIGSNFDATVVRAAFFPATEDVAANSDTSRIGPPAQSGVAAAGDQKGTEASSAPSGRFFGIGDKLKLTFYEHLDVEDAKWGRASSALRGIEQRPELSGEYAVQEDGAISVPLLGSVTVAAQSEQQVQAALAQMFEKKFARKGMVNVFLMERPPVYVLGPVKNPGSFKYVPGMTVLHAVALAGGLDRERGSNEPWQKIEAVRTVDKRGAAIEAMLKLLARQAVLRAERDGSRVKMPVRLVKLVGPTEAASMVDEQLDRRKAVAMARRERERAAENAVESAKQDLRMYARTDSLDDLVKSRQDRVESTRVLVEKNILAKTTLNQVQAELSDAEQRRQDAFNQYSQAKQRLNQLENDALRARADITNELQGEIELADRQIIENQHELDTSEGVLRTLPATRAKFAESSSKAAEQISYIIVRQTATGPSRIEANGMAVLRPGDLVDIAVGAAGPGGSDHGTPQLAPTPPQDQPRLMERTSREIGGVSN